jgi:hypothetical protein
MERKRTAPQYARASATRAANREIARAEARQDRLLIPREDAAVMIGCCTRTCKRLEKRGKLTPIRLTPGGRVFYTPDNLQALTTEEGSHD